MTERSTDVRAHLEALFAGVLFGAGTPLSKLLLGVLDPLLLAGLLYLGAGIVAGLFLLVRPRDAGSPNRHSLARTERLALAGAVLCGGVAAPIVMMYGLAVTPAGTASLLLNFEAAATTLVAAVAFHEAIGRRVWLAIALITTAACFLAWRSEAAWGVSLGATGIVAACLLWGIDNNLTRMISGRDAMTIVCVKGWGAGIFSLALSLVLGAELPGIKSWAAAIVLGSVSYGLSIALFVRALRSLGAARTGALFGVAPFVGALVAWVFLAESPSAAALASFPLMAIGAFLLLTESHRHPHHHAKMEHEHSHRHDDGHHDHAHEGPDVPAGVVHSHRHRHVAVTHDHPHAPDLHHRHRHDDD